MNIPIEFGALGSSFYAGSFVDGMTANEWIDSRVSILDVRQRKIALEFLNGLLTGSPEIHILQEAWRRSDSDYCLADADILAFLKMLREALAK